MSLQKDYLFHFVVSSILYLLGKAIMTTQHPPLHTTGLRTLQLNFLAGLT